MQKNALGSIENKIVVQIENQIITSYEIKNKILTSLYLAKLKVNQDNINQLKRTALNSLINYKLKKIQLVNLNIKDDYFQIDKYLKSISKKNINDLKLEFKNNNINFELFLDQIKVQFQWQKYIYQIYSKKIEIDESSINAELKEIIANKKDLVEYKISEIEILSDDNISLQEKILKTQNEIKNVGFGSTAIKYSSSSSAPNRGDLGWINIQSLSKQIAQIIKNMNVGDISEPIKKQNSALLLKLVDKRILKTKNIDQVKLKNSLVASKKNELFKLYSDSHLSKLKNNSLIEYK